MTNNQSLIYKIIYFGDKRQELTIYGDVWWLHVANSSTVREKERDRQKPAKPLRQARYNKTGNTPLQIHYTMNSPNSVFYEFSKKPTHFDGCYFSLI